MMPTILIVDDDHTLTALLRQTLADEGYRVLSTADGKEALAQAQAHRPDLVVLDWVMPGLSGLEVARRLRAAAGMPILMLTTRETRRGDRAFALRPKEFALLAYLLRHPRQVLPRARILEEVWGADFDGTDSVLDVYIRYLRAKTEAGGEPRLIQTVRGVGYVLRAG